MTDHTWGLDKSHFDAPTGTATIVAEGFGFMTHKAGGDANDAELNTWWNDAKPHRADILLGAYWVLYPGHGSGAGDSFVARLDSQCPGWRDGPFILQLDCEEWGGDPGTMPSVSEIRACANRLRVLCPKLMPIVYAPRWAYGNTLTGLGYPLWSSAYTSTKGSASAIYPGDSYTGWTAYSGIVPTIAQFSSTATVAGDSTTDVNCFKGTPAQLSQLLAPGWETVDMSFEDDQVPVKYPSQDPNNPTWTGPNALGDARDRAAEAVTRISAAQNAITSIQGSMATALSALSAISVKLNAGVTANVDVAALAAALDALLPPVTVTEDVVLQAFRDMAAAATPARQVDRQTADTDTPIADNITRQLRQERQPGIQGG
jgi:hypothetical protein